MLTIIRGGSNDEEPDSKYNKQMDV